MRAAIRALLALAILAPPAAAAPPKPKLIVAISVDQFSADLFAEYRAHFTSGLKRLAGGAVFPAGYQSHAATETCPGHATILTGSRPARSGIIANSWFDPGIARADKKVYCAEDPAAPGSSSNNYTVSAQYLKVLTLGDRLKAADPRSQIVAVAGKDRAAVMMGGHATDQIWFYSGKSFITLAERPGPAPNAVATVNARLMERPRRSVLPASCRSRAPAVEIGKGRQVGVPGKNGAFRTSSAFDAATADIAIGLLSEMKLGRGPATDLFAIGLSATDYVGHSFGTEGAEMCANLVALDETIGRILAALDANRAPYAVVLTADHGGHDLPERNRLRGIEDAERIDPALLPANVITALSKEFGLSSGTIYADAPFGDWYVSHALAPDLRQRVLTALLERLRAHRQVAAVFTAGELATLPLPTRPADEWMLAERARAGFDPARSGDLIVFLKPHITPIVAPGSGSIATHGSPWNYDRRVPILFWWPGIKGFEQPLPVEAVDIMPTLAGLIALPVPQSEIDGHCLDLDSGEGTTCLKEF